MADERTASEEELAQMLADADAIALTEDWDKTIAAYRKVLTFDRFYQGTEAKLQWAIRMRDTDSVYKKGLAELAAGNFVTARQHLNKARLLYASAYKDADKLIIETWYAEGKAAFDAGKLDEALTAWRKVRDLSKSHYKDTDELIVQAETQMQKNKWNARSMNNTKPKGCFLFGALALMLILTVVVLSACSGWVPVPTLVPTVTRVAVATAQPGAQPGSQMGAPATRNNMYKSAPPLTIDPNKAYTATIKTAKGNIVVSLDAKSAPQTVNNFVFLSRSGFYDGLTFHRVELTPTPFVIQGGDPLGTGSGGPGYTIPAEIKLPHVKGAIAMARLPDQMNPKRDSSGSQFYITLDATPFLDGGYTAFGQVASGMDVVTSIRVGDVMQAITIDEK